MVLEKNHESPLDGKEIQPVHPKEINPEYSLEGLMLKLQYFGHLMQRPDSPVPTLQGPCGPLGWTGWISLPSKGLSRVFSNTTVQKHQFFSAQLSSLQSCPTVCNPIDGSPPGPPVPGILQARTLELLPFPSPMELVMPHGQRSLEGYSQ